MDSNKDKLLKRIVKLFALSESDNPNESALALQKGQELMREHGFTELEVSLANIEERRAKINAVKKPPAWMVRLAICVSDAFSTGVLFKYSDLFFEKQAFFVFIGDAVKCELSEYSFTVLFRKLQKARSAYLKKLRGKRANRIAKADLYATGWVAAIQVEVNRFAQKKPQAVLAYLEQRCPAKTTVKQRKPKHGSTYEHEAAGYIDGKQVNLQHGVDTIAPKEITGRE